MKLRYLRYSLPVFIATIFQSCSTDLNLNADWKEIPVVYGILNQNDSIHYVRVQKAYLGEGSVLTMATETDSIYYSDSLDVTLQAYEFGQKKGEEVSLEPTFVLKEDGDFATDGHYVYRTPDSFTEELNIDYDYKVTVTNTNTGNVATGETPIIEPPIFNAPNALNINFNATAPLQIRWTTKPNGKLYQPSIRFHYNEDGVDKYVDMVLNSYTSSGVLGGQSLSAEIERVSFYKFLEGTLEPSATAKRIPINLEFIVTVAAEDFNTFMEVQAPSSGVVQHKPEFTNIENGTGLFSSRTEVSIIRDFHESTIDSIVCGQYTKDLHFGELITSPSAPNDTIYCQN